MSENPNTLDEQIDQAYAHLLELKQRRAERDSAAMEAGLALPLGEGRRIIDEARAFLSQSTFGMGSAQENPLPLMPEWSALTVPRYQAALFTFQALRTLGEYPHGAPDYDPVAVKNLRSALASLLPGFGNLETLGEPRPCKQVASTVDSTGDPVPAPSWVADVLAGETSA